MIDVVRVTKTYKPGKVEIHALRGVSFQIADGERIAIQGPSGSGKSTLLNLIGLLDLPTSGEVKIDGRSSLEMSETERSHIRNRTIGFVFQRFNLIPQLSALENVALPGKYAGINMRERRKRARQLLEKVGLPTRADHLPAELSGGEEQRVAIARALFMHPKVVLADEPTGNLDSESGRRIMELLEKIHQAGAALVIVTHDQGIASIGSRILHLKDGLIIHTEEAFK